MAHDYARCFAEITLTHDFMTEPHERTWRLAPPLRAPEHHAVVLDPGFDLLGPGQRASRVDPAAARQLVISTFPVSAKPSE